MTQHHSDKILDCVEMFIETHPDLEHATIGFNARATGEDPTVRMQQVRINDETYLVVCKRVGG